MTFVPIPEQVFTSQDHWVRTAKYRLTNHPDFFNSEHNRRGYVKPHFRALCFDQNGRGCQCGDDFDKAVYPVWYVWPDQLYELISYKEKYDKLVKACNEAHVDWEVINAFRS